ncbi:unnamed protein product, partial [Heterotrigona itama]
MGSSGMASERGGAGCWRKQWRRLGGSNHGGWNGVCWLVSQEPAANGGSRDALQLARGESRNRSLRYHAPHSRSFYMLVRSSPPRFHARGHASRLLARWNATREGERFALMQQGG